MQDSQKAVLIVNLIDLIMTKGIPAYMKWQDGMELKDPTIEDFEALKVTPLPELPETEG